jgi:urease beta subunit
LLARDPIAINAGRPMRRLEVANTGDRPGQVGSHFHGLEVNRYLICERAAGAAPRQAECGAAPLALGRARRFRMREGKGPR